MYISPEEFNQMCQWCQVEASITALPNPGSIFQACRRVLIKNYSDKTVMVHQQDQKLSTHYIPAEGTIEFMMKPGEDLPTLERLG